MGADNTPDFSGWATKANLKCSDGRTITVDAFKDQDGSRVPLVWQHGHNEIANVLGHAILTNKPEGVWCDAYFNSTDMGKIGKTAVQHGDVTSLSIYANKLVEKSKSVLHGVIREVSLVLAGANPGAFIDPLTVKHGDGSYEEIEDAAFIYTDADLIIHGALENTDTADKVEEKEDNVADVQHADSKTDEGGETVKDIFETMSDKQKDVVYFLIAQASSGKTPAAAHSGTEAELADEPTSDEINEVIHSMDDKQKDVVLLLVGDAMQRAEAQGLQHTDTDAAAADADTDNTAAHSATEEGTTTMRVFENNDGVQHSGTSIGRASSGTKLSKADQLALIQKSLRHGGVESLKEFVQDYIEDGALAHGIDSIETLFPDAKNVTTTPDWLTRRTEWVARVMTGTRHVPFSRISSQTADLTLDDARAKGYVKGNFKKEQFFKIAKRKTGPTTIYKKQKLERDDVIDITDFDVIVWIKGEMRLMLEAEVARAILLGDGRAVDHEDKVDEESIRPIATDAELFVTRVYVDDSKDDYTPEEALELLILNRRHYRGSGNPVFFTSETFLAQMLLVKDGVNRRIYNTPADVAAALRVSDIITVDLLDEPTTDVVGIMVNLNDYTVGADRGGDVTLFDDFDINFNALLYLIETRLSGALVKAKSAIVVLRTLPDAVLVDPVAPTYDKAANTVTVKTTSGIVYRNKATNAVLTTGQPVTLAEGDTLVVVAEATSGNYLESSANDEFSFAYGRGRVAGSIY